MRKEVHPARSWYSLMQQQKAFRLEFFHDYEACHIATWPREALGEPGADRVVANEEYDRHSRGGRLRRPSGETSAIGNHDVRPCCDCLTRNLLDALRRA